MAWDDKTPTGRDLDEALRLEAARLTERVRERMSSHEDEDTGMIEIRARQMVSGSPTPPRYKLYQRIIDRLPPWGLVFVIGAVIFALTYSGALSALVEWAKK